MPAITTTVGFLRVLLQDTSSRIWTDDYELLSILQAKSYPYTIQMTPELTEIYTSYVPASNPLVCSSMCVLDSDPTPVVKVDGVVTVPASIRNNSLRLTFSPSLAGTEEVYVYGRLVDIMGAAADLLEARATSMLNMEAMNTRNLDVGGGSDYKNKAEGFMKLAKQYREQSGFYVSKHQPNTILIVEDSSPSSFDYGLETNS